MLITGQGVSGGSRGERRGARLASPYTPFAFPCAGEACKASAPSSSSGMRLVSLAEDEREEEEDAPSERDPNAARTTFLGSRRAFGQAVEKCELYLVQL